MSYENGVESFKFGDDTGNNLWLNQENMYFVDEDEVENIYNQVKDLEAYSFEGKVVIDPALDVGDKIIIDERPVIYQGEADFQTRFIAQISSKISIKQKQETTVKTTSQKVLNRRVQSRIDEVEGKITTLVEETNENSSKLTKVEQDIDGITQTVSSVETKIETVEDKAEQAQTSANTANTNAQNAQHAANNAQNTANSAVSQIETTTEKLAEVEQSVDGFTQTVSSIETQIETIDSKADSAQDSADEAISKAETTTKKVSQIEQTVEGVTQTVENVQTNLNENYSTTEQMNSAIEQSAGNITSSVSESIENIQVGGTNLIRNSAPYNMDFWIAFNANVSVATDEDINKEVVKMELKQNSSNLSGAYNNTQNYLTLEKNKEYSASMWLKGSKAMQVLVRHEGASNQYFDITTEWKKYSYQFICGDPKKNFIIYAISPNTGDTLYLHSIKLEEGNKVTSWSPAPEDDVKEFEFGTKIEQNSKYVQYAWNNESQNIKLEQDNGNSTMGFYDNDTKFAEMGVNNVDNDRYISFAIPCNYGQNIADGMAWGIQTPDGKFWPILYIKDFHMANKNAGDFSGNLVLTACNLLLEGTNSSITCGNVNITNAGVFGGVMFENANTHQQLLTIMPDNGGEDAVSILNKISFYKNLAGSNTLRVGLEGQANSLITDEGYISCEEIYANKEISCNGNINAFGHIYCNNGVEPFSLAEKKRDIEKYNNKALNEVLNTDIYYYNYKDDKQDIKRRVGAIIGEDYKCSKEIVGTEGKGIDIYSMLSLSYKAIQEQQELIEKQNNTIKDLQYRIEKLEQKVGVANE